MDLQDPKLWHTVAFILFFVLVAWKAGGAIRGLFRNYQNAIRAQLDEAATLRQQAEALLADSQVQLAQAEQDARDVVVRAREEADALRKRQMEQLQKDLARREQQALRRIAQAEQAAARDLQRLALDKAIDAVKAEAAAALTVPRPA